MTLSLTKTSQKDSKLANPTTTVRLGGVISSPLGNCSFMAVSSKSTANWLMKSALKSQTATGLMQC